ncbi:GlcNAc phosphomutase [Cutibacterium acnes JCM 18920]|nr:GlcNAc phosphomutase [Cutibacterium acnes JCM 18920]
MGGSLFGFLARSLSCGFFCEMPVAQMARECIDKVVKHYHFE